MTIERELQDRDMPSPTICRLRSEDDRTQMLTKRDPTLLADLKRLVEPATLGAPERPLLWVSKSLGTEADVFTGVYDTF